MAESRVLIGRKAIEQYLEVSKTTFFALVDDGMPAALRRIGGREYWISDKDLMDDWFKALVIGVDMAPGALYGRWLAAFGDGVAPGDRSLVFNPN